MSDSDANSTEFQDQPTLPPVQSNGPGPDKNRTLNDPSLAVKSHNENTPSLVLQGSGDNSPALDPPTLPPRIKVVKDDQSTKPKQIQSSVSIARSSCTELQSELPRQFGDYLLLNEIARGGMGVVYKAKQERLNRIVAVKMILTGQFAGKEDVLRFYAEAEAAANLNHSGVVPIYEVGQLDGQHFFSMGFVDGPSLATLISERPIEPSEAAVIAVQTAEVIGFAHSKGVIHRDLKPANVLLDRIEGSSSNSIGTQRLSKYGTPKVTDFGLAKQIGIRSELTATGQILGTPGYMPPEQAAGKTNEVNELADVYSLGGVLYAMLTGTAPFQAATPIDTLIQVLEREPTPPRQINSKIPVDLETICLKCLQKDQKRRYQSANELIDDLNRFIDGSPILARPVTSTERLWRWSRKHPAVAVLSLFSAALMLVIVIAAPIIAFRQSQLRMAESIAKNDAISVSVELEVAKDEAEASHYSANISLAYSLWAQGSLTRARHLLNQSPHRFRNWEWWFLDRLCSGNAIPLRGNAAQTPEVRFKENGRLLGLTTMATARQWDIETGLPCDSIKIGAVKCSFDRYANRMVSWIDDEAFSNDLPAILVKKSFYQPGIPIVLCVHAFDSTEIAILRKSARQGESFSDDVLSLEIVDGTGGDTVTVIENLPASVNPKVALSPSAKQFAYIADGNNLIWGAKTSNWTSNTFELKNYKATQVGFSPATKYTDGHELLTVACSDGVIRVFQLDHPSGALNLKSQLETTGAEVTALTWNASATFLAAGSNDRLVSIWQYGESNTRSIFRGIDANITSLSFSKDSRHIAAGAEFGIKAWKIGFEPSDSRPNNRRGLSRQDNQSLPISVGHLTEIAASSDDRTCCVIDETNRIYNIDTNTWKFSELPIRSWLKGGYAEAPFPPPVWNPGIPMRLELSPDGRTLAFTIAALVDAPSLDIPVRVKSSIVLWDLVSQIPTRVLGEHDNLVTCMSFTPDGKTLVAGTGLTADTRQIIKQLSRVGSRIEDRKNTIRVWDVSTGLADLDLCTRSENYSVMTFSSDGHELYCSGDFATIDVWNWQEKKLQRQIKTPAAITPSQIQFAELPNRVDLRLGDSSFVQEKEQLGVKVAQKTSNESIGVHSSSNANMQISNIAELSQNNLNGNVPDEERRYACVMTSGMDGRIRIYDSVAGGLLRILEGHSNRATGVLPIDRGNRIASCSEDGTVRIWDPVFGTELLCLPHDGQIVRGAAWLARSKTLLTISDAGLLSVWQAGEDSLPEVDNWQDILDEEESAESQWIKVSGQWQVNGRSLHGIMENVAAFQAVGELAVARIDLKDEILPDTAMLEFNVALNDGTALQILINDKNDDGEVIELATAPNPFTQRVGISISKRGDQQNLRELVANPSVLLVSGKTHKVQILRNPHSITVLIDGETVLRATLPTTLDCGLALQGTFGKVGSVVSISNLSIRSSKSSLEQRDAWKTISQWVEEEMVAARVLKRIDQNDSWSFELKRFARQRANGIAIEQRKIFEKIEEWLSNKNKDLSRLKLMIELCRFSIEQKSQWAEWLQLAFCQELAGDYQSSLESVRKSIDLCVGQNGHAMPSQWGLVAICNYKRGRVEAAKKALIKANRSLSFVQDDENWDHVSEAIHGLFGPESNDNGLSEPQQNLLDFVTKNKLEAWELYTDDFTCVFEENGMSRNDSSTVDRDNWVALGKLLELPGTIGLEDCFIFDHDVSDVDSSPSVLLYVVRELKLASSAIYTPSRWQTLKILFQLESSGSTWKIKKQVITPLSAKLADLVYSFANDDVARWDELLNAQLSSAKSLSARERYLLAEQLLYAFREREAIVLLESIVNEASSTAEQQALLSLAASRIGNESLTRKAGEKAIQLKPSINSPRFLERIASAKFRQSENVNIGKSFFADIPRSWKRMGSESFSVANDIQIGWIIDPPQACASVLYKVEGATRDQFMTQIKIANSTYKRTVLEERPIVIANTDALWTEVEGPGNGGIIDGEGRVLTRQIFVILFLEREVLMLSLIGPAESWSPLKARFEAVVSSITLGPKQ